MRVMVWLARWVRLLVNPILIAQNQCRRLTQPAQQFSYVVQGVLTRTFEAARQPIVVGRPLPVLTRTASAAESRDSITSDVPGVR